MKIFFKTLLLLTAVAAMAFAPALSGLDEVLQSLRRGNAKELAKYVDDNIEISTPQGSASYSRGQALQVLENFFATNTVQGFEVKHRGDNGGAQFCIGTLQTGKGAYRTTVFMKVRGGQQVVREIRFQSN